MYALEIQEWKFIYYIYTNL